MPQKSLRGAYVTVQFPKPLEAFVGVELRTLREMNVRPSVYSYIAEHPDSPQMLSASGLQDIPVSHGNLANHVRAVATVVMHPWMSFRLVLFVLSKCWSNIRQLLVSLLLIPRTLQIFADIKRDRPDVVHFFWGHYPSLLGFLFSQFLQDQVFSSSLGAYDLLANYKPVGAVAKHAAFVRTWAACNVPDMVRQGIPSEKIMVNYRGIDIEAIQARRVKKMVRHRFAFAGRLIPLKAVDRVIRTFAGICQEYPAATLHIMGDGPERANLEGLAKTLGVHQKVEFFGTR